MPETASSRNTVLASLGALLSIIAAASCCLPLIPFLAAAGLAGSSTLLAPLRPYLLAVSVLLIAYGFYRGHQLKRCNRRPSRLSTILLWSSAVIVFVSILFPQAVAALLAG